MKTYGSSVRGKTAQFHDLASSAAVSAVQRLTVKAKAASSFRRETSAAQWAASLASTPITATPDFDGPRRTLAGGHESYSGKLYGNSGGATNVLSFAPAASALVGSPQVSSVVAVPAAVSAEAPVTTTATPFAAFSVPAASPSVALKVVTTTTEPASVLTTAPVADAALSASPADEATAKAMSDWRGSWISAAATTPCGSCTGRACTMCSVRTGGPTATNGRPTGYAQRTLMFYQPEESIAPSIDKIAPALTTSALRTDTTSAVTALAVTATNAIVLENQKQGTPESVWMIGTADPTIEGYAAQFSLNHGNTVDFKINTNSKDYTIEIYRLGYYGGDGARRVATIERDLAVAQFQPAPLFDPTTKLVDAGNWSVSASWAIPQDAMSGVYFARLERHDGSGGENMIPFIVRDDNAPSDITFQTSDTTWQAYNWWGGYNFYGGVDEGGHAGRASAVSYNRPIITRDGGFAAGPQDFIFGAEYSAIRFLEQNGYDVDYISGIDSARDAAQLLNSKIFLSVGHDEYWSGEQRDNVEAARDAGVNLSFWSGNEVYWETRWEASIDGSGTPYKTLVSYKERWDNANTDTVGTTSTWRDPVFGSGDPENSLTGTIFTVDSYRLDAINVPYDMSNLRFWSNTAVANLQPGQVYTLTQNLLGYEWDSDLDNGFRPAGLVPLSSTTVDVQTKLLDYGNAVGPGTASHALTLYRAPSGALVFGAGTVYWSWGLDSHHDNEATPTDPNVQQSMINLFAEMGVQPATLMQSLAVAAQSTDHVAPTTTIAQLPAGLTAAQAYTISGTATDTGGGLVAVVEVSTDGGATWHRATGYNNWTYTWTPSIGGNYTIRSRAVDDSVNLETPSAGRTVTVAQAAASTLFQPGDTPAVPFEADNNAVTVGVSFTSSQSGSIVGLRYYKGTLDAGEHTGSLWSSTGALLAKATFTNESPNGWQTVVFSNPISITAGTTYIASYFGNFGYAVTQNYFSSPHTNGPLTATNGFFTYGAQNAFPTSPSGGSNYWVDVVFNPTPTPNQAPTGNNDNGYLVARNTAKVFTFAQLLANDTDPNNDILTVIGAGAASGGTVVFNAQQQTVTFTPNAGYLGAATFGYSISDGRGGTGSAFVNMDVVTSLSSSSLFTTADTPTDLTSSDANRVNLGVRFVASAAGSITGLRYYKSAGDTGTHVGSLWSSTGVLLASATFVNETSSGWQTVNFGSPVQIAAGTTYVASYLSNGHYASTTNYFVTDKVSGPLTAPAASNGVYSYGTTSAMPTSTYSRTNYWVDVLMTSTTAANQPPVAANDAGFTTPNSTALTLTAAALLANDTDPDGNPLSISGVSAAVNGTVAFNAQTNTVVFTPTAGYSGAASFVYAISDGFGGTASASVALTVGAPANRPPVATNDTGFTTQQGAALQIAASALLGNDNDPDGDALTITGVSGGTNGTVSFNAQTNIVTFTPTAGYTGAASFTYAVADGRGGSASAGVALTVTAALPAGSTLFAANATPANANINDPSSVELGMRFTVAASGSITGMRFYKGAQNTGTHTGTLWTSTGTQLGTVTFTNESASGWQSASFSNPIAVATGTTYVISYHTNTGFYSGTGNYFGTAATTNGPLTAPQSTVNGGNGVFAYGAGSIFPTGSHNATNYWVDVYYQGSTNVAPVATNDSGLTVQRNASVQIAAATLLANDTDANGDPLTITGVSGATNGTVSFNAQTNIVTFTPTTNYVGAASFSYAISDGRGGTASANAALTVSTPASAISLFAPTATPTTVSVNDPNGVELGMKFTSSQAGTISGIRFYKGAQNTGTHTGTLWSSAGANLGTLTFQNETASGWQTASFAAPIAITAGATYIVSYHSNGNYSATGNGFGSAVTSGPLTAPSSATSGGNGLYAYGSASAFPTNSYNATNYYVDVVFNGSLAS
ncbi:MAG: hypothetical protein JWR51_140 [Devosia sp.]|uniref:DUF4082 domain-containing protein n=1 Tax=Devosia sp. TaxID=1871048 RepID=UPI0026184BF4|nr:DUF4082 domain-containing protein [Devosia sp.]MDB5527037.1 hypothetical protein [Devosia sp.]